MAKENKSRTPRWMRKTPQERKNFWMMVLLGVIALAAYIIFLLFFDSTGVVGLVLFILAYLFIFVFV